MKKNTLIQSLGFSDQDHKNQKHDAAIFFIKEPHILKSILETLKINFPNHIENPLKGFGYQTQLAISNVKINKIEDIFLETEVPITKGSTKDNKYTIGFLDGILNFTVEYEANCNQQLKHQEIQ